MRCIKTFREWFQLRRRALDAGAELRRDGFEGGRVGFGEEGLSFYKEGFVTRAGALKERFALARRPRHGLSKDVDETTEAGGFHG